MNPFWESIGLNKGRGLASEKEGLVPRTVFQTTGSSKQLLIKGDDGSDFVLEKHSKFSQLAVGNWTYELVQNSGAGGQNAHSTKLILVKSGWGRSKVTIADAKGQPFVELGGSGKLFQRRFARKFVWGGREYQWEHSPHLFGDTRLILIDLDSKTVLAERTLSGWSWQHKGAITLFHVEGDLIPTAWILATALAFEQLWRDDENATGGAIAATAASGT